MSMYLCICVYMYIGVYICIYSNNVCILLWDPHSSARTTLAGNEVSPGAAAAQTVCCTRRENKLGRLPHSASHATVCLLQNWRQSCKGTSPKYKTTPHPPTPGPHALLFSFLLFRSWCLALLTTSAGPPCINGDVYK